ncbi:2-amino-4-hydroxy-6-hydroxymethyldihydropteridine diphosphokinase [Candidatus Symbiothrix dinenymphae]|uniref:2-amino-4-hydroxy-6- hydroxymethyldihydropteridine diphosphokinase n=1 Tax=Candidatus Symbiothrix dinenymphae TaxID=467085 RepID=UPI0006C58642|nr:2-amino-4-hydroxy-6-hydroxymethyldihydropteridine diphosphokinase [Candidatus Symbiothrix dinenymphae]GAP71615.1 hypothetical protein SAMD00024442_15_19 [Candidatus Symbiothrix dinenymphae]
MVAYLALGSNLGEKETNLRTAIDFLNQQAGTITARSSVHQTAPWGFESTNSFLNMAVCLQTDLSPIDLLHTVKAIEQQMGRRPKTDNHYHDRLIDIDIILYDDVVMQSDELTLPHPLYKQRAFVLEPLEEIR